MSNIPKALHQLLVRPVLLPVPVPALGINQPHLIDARIGAGAYSTHVLDPDAGRMVDKPTTNGNSFLLKVLESKMALLTIVFAIF